MWLVRLTESNSATLFRSFFANICGIHIYAQRFAILLVYSHNRVVLLGSFQQQFGATSLIEQVDCDAPNTLSASVGEFVFPWQLTKIKMVYLGTGCVGRFFL